MIRALLLLATIGSLGCRSVMPHTVALPEGLSSPPEFTPALVPVQGDGFTRSDIAFPCGEVSCAAWLYLPLSITAEEGAIASAPPPVVVMGNGFTGQREMVMPDYAERFAQNGIAAFVFDYRHWGDSGGIPRYEIVAEEQIEDYLSAVTHVRALDQVDGDRVALWGTSFSGGHVVIAASRDPGIDAIVGQVPLTDGRAEADLKVKWKQIWPLVRLSFMDKHRERKGEERLYVKAVGGEDEVVFLPGYEAGNGMLSLVPEGSDWPNLVAPALLLDADEYRPIKVAEEVTCPTLFVLAGGDIYVPNKATHKTAERMADAEIVTIDAVHFEIYKGEAFEESVSAQLEFLTEHLAP
jgi:dienelactone hydrolase